MYGLFLNTYDWYEWHDLVCVSKDKDVLVKRAEADEKIPLLEQAVEFDRTHYVIHEIEEL